MIVTDRTVEAAAHGCLRAGMAILVFPALVAACAAPATEADTVPKQTVAPEVYEFANMRRSNIVPKSSPTALVAAFEKFCLNGSHAPARVAANLRSADYVAVPKQEPDGVTAFVVDDTRPMVMVSDNGRTCAVGATSRSGQTARIRDMIARRYPGAATLDPAEVGPNTELAVRAAGTEGGVIFLQRLAPTISQSRLILGIWREK